MKLLIEKTAELDYPGLVAKLDIHKAYDHVSWQGIHRMLMRRGIPDDIAIAFLRLISNTTMLFRCEDDDVAEVRPRRGIKQGSPESTAVFSTVVDECLGLAFGDLSGLRIGDLLLPWHALGWVDDVFLLASSWSELTHKLRRLAGTLQDVDLELSWEKCAVLACGSCRRDAPQTLAVQTVANTYRVPVVKADFRCLGVFLSSGTGEQPSLRFALQKAWNAFFAQRHLWVAQVPLAAQSRNLNTLVKPVWSWAAGVLHLSRGQVNQLRVAQRRMVSYCFRRRRLPEQTWVEAHRQRFRDAAAAIRVEVEHDELACWGNLALARYWRFLGHSLRTDVNQIAVLLGHKDLEWWQTNRHFVTHPARWHVRRHEQEAFQYCSDIGMNMRQLAQSRDAWRAHEPHFVRWMLTRGF